MISVSLAEALQSRRSDLNQRFRLAAQAHPQLDGEKLLRFVAECIDPIAQAVHAQHPEAVDDVVATAYECALQLVGQQLTERQGRYAVLAELWRDVLPVAASALVSDSRRLIPALTNALHQLTTVDSAAAARWTQRIGNAAAVTSAEELLQLGQVFAWQCGLAHYRDGALSALNSLSEPLLCLALQVTPAQREKMLQRLHANRWFDPASAENSALRIVHSTGTFRGFNGTFLHPPLVRSTSGGWLVQSAGDHWFLIADAFGATLHRATANEWSASTDQPHHVGTRVVHESGQLDVSGAGPITSSALSEHAIACTFAHSHHIVLVALSS
jgi:hypothetical protein